MLCVLLEKASVPTLYCGASLFSRDILVLTTGGLTLIHDRVDERFQARAILTASLKYKIPTSLPGCLDLLSTADFHPSVFFSCSSLWSLSVPVRVIHNSKEAAKQFQCVAMDCSISQTNFLCLILKSWAFCWPCPCCKNVGRTS